MRSSYSCTLVLTGRASRAAHPPVPTVTNTGPAAPGVGGRWYPSMSGLGFHRAARKLIETDLHPPHLDGVPAPLDRGQPRRALPHPASPPSPRAAVLPAPAGPALRRHGRRRHPDNLRLGHRALRHIAEEHRCATAANAGGRGSGPSQPSGSFRPHDPARMRLPASGAGWMEPSRPGRRTGQAGPRLGPRIASGGRQATHGRSRYRSGDWLRRRRWQTGGRCCTLRGRGPPPLERSPLRAARCGEPGGDQPNRPAGRSAGLCRPADARG
jgi:hypothetical protein